MTYRVTFRKRFNREGEPADNPVEFLDLPDGVVEDAEFSEMVEPDSLHNEERMEEDDDFQSLGHEIWEFEVVDERQDEFVTALKNSRLVMEYIALDDEAPL